MTIVVLTLMACVVLVNLLVGGEPVRSGPQGQFTACKSNLKNIGTAVEMYLADDQRPLPAPKSGRSSGSYPPSLELVTPDYLKVIPTCPVAGSPTYREGYTATRDAYTVVCKGTHHGQVSQGENYPQYTSTNGLISQ